MKRTVANRFSTPAFILDRRALLRNIAAASEAFAGWTIGYSVKTNSHPSVLKEILDAGLCAEVVSEHEYRLARDCGFPPDRIIYNGPVKGFDSFREAVLNGALVNIDSWHEIEWLAQISAPVRVGLRINIRLEDETDPAVSRFGFSEESGDLAEAFRRLHALPHVTVNALHLHRNARGRRVDNYRRAVRQALGIIERYDPEGKIDTFDIGGNFSAPLPGKPSFAHYARAVESELHRPFRLIAEPGNALISTAIDYLTTVTDVRTACDGTVFVTVDGRRNDIDPLFRANDWKRQVIPATKEYRPTVPLQQVCGCTCMEQDRILQFADSPALRPGDRLVIHHAGAYTATLAPASFSTPVTPLHVLDIR